MRKFLKGYYLALFFLILCSSGCDNQDPEPEQNDNIVNLVLGNQTIYVEIADSPEEWQLGLSYRDTLAENHGMLFVFPEEKRRTFWMLGCNFDIDLAYIESDGTISEIITMEKEAPDTPPFSLTEYTSQSTTIRYALEMIGGWFEENNVSAQIKLDLSQL
jgi:uncharacterized membrane protein (UPF0127 family)